MEQLFCVAALLGAIVLLALTVHLARTGRQRARRMESVNSALRKEMEERKRTEQELHRQQSVLQNIIDNIPCAVFWKDRNSIFLGCNNNLARDAGMSAPQEVIGKSDFDFPVTHEEAAAYVKHDGNIMETGQPLHNHEETQRRLDGQQAVLLTSKVPLRDDNGAIVGVLGTYTDVTEWKQAQRALKASEARYQLLFDSNPFPMWVFDHATLGFLAVNKAAIEHYGFSRDEFLAMTVKDIRPPAGIPSLLAVLAQPPPHPDFVGVWQHRKKNGTLIDVSVTAHSVTFAGRDARLVLAHDVTERRRAEEQLRQAQEQLRQAQKMEAVGQLAGGVAHDFNNLLTIINGYCEILLGALKEEQPARDYVEQIKHAGERAAALTRQLLAFGRKQMLQVRVVDLNTIVADTEKMLRRLIGENIDLHVKLSPGPLPVLADLNQLQHVLLNLTVNARDAMPDGGRLTVAVGCVELEAGGEFTRPDVAPGPYVLLAVSDTGHGMSSETKERIFEPFFTTKEMGKGTGLGLATVYGIVKQSNGHIEVESEPGRGATFRIYLPRSEKTPSAQEVQPGYANVPRGSEKVLLAEDDDAVRLLACRILRTCGYTVLEARSGEEAALVWQRNESIAMLVTDVIMPGMNGRQLAQQLTLLRPELKVLYISGYTDQIIDQHGVLENGSALLHKPFTQMALARKVRELLDGDRCLSAAKA